MNAWPPSPSRRAFVRGAAGALAAASAERLFTVRGAFAEALTATPRQTEGPFYPDHLPLDTDNDLIIVGDRLTPAVGEVTHLRGRVLSAAGSPVRDALVEIWQVDANGIYLHTRDRVSARDAGFQGFGRFLTGSTGEYYFRTLKPVAYGGRTPHIHFALKRKGREKWTTQAYVKGEPQNERDFVFRGIADPRARESVLVDFVPLPGSQAGEQAARFDIVLGFTPSA